ncbi:hypothetical protein F5Y00DRAFT_264555 [Daldinia vernicosa]|uniref:uncharacterized protein n=1 Tax=Daldinia vernicosa TaxID=114800 RepID=UPI002008D86F|nr:uncharacterized protein F5Y00DRAFT_264555 [Daldinia vernicosa]KAI0846359.1 hypothetical protein F5Y00DRAFT_264555 [Daldinia vernicosa]
MTQNQGLLFQTAGEGAAEGTGVEYGLVLGYLEGGSFKVQVLREKDENDPYIVTAVAKKHLSVIASDIVLLSADKSTPEDVEIIKVFEEDEIEALLIRGDIPSRFATFPID